MTGKTFHEGIAQKFGGPWTIIKVETVVGYLEAFTTLLVNKPSRGSAVQTCVYRRLRR